MKTNRFSGRKLLLCICLLLGCVTIQLQSDAQVNMRWKSFNAVLNDKDVMLNWSIASEVNNPTFFVEHSTDGRTWHVIGTIHGTTDLGMVAKENYKHINPGPGVHQYRIRQESPTGKSTYSEIITVNIKSNGQLATWPNPARNTINIQSGQTNENNAALWAKFYDLSGNLVKQVDLKAGNNAVDISRLKPDMYIIQIRLPNGKNDNQKIIKQ